jgi:hypothetical protein
MENKKIQMFKCFLINNLVMNITWLLERRDYGMLEKVFSKYVMAKMYRYTRSCRRIAKNRMS